MIVRLFKVTEHSLTPEYQEGDFVLTFKIPLLSFRYKPGDIVVFERPPYGRMIKQVQAVLREQNALFVIGFHPESVDSRQFGPIPVEAVLGKVIWHIKRPSTQ